MFAYYLPGAFTCYIVAPSTTALPSFIVQIKCCVGVIFNYEDNDWIWLFANGKDTSQGASRLENGHFSGQTVSADFIHPQYSYNKLLFCSEYLSLRLGFANQDLDACG